MLIHALKLRGVRAFPWIINGLHALKKNGLPLKSAFIKRDQWNVNTAWTI